ncbi:unnamed protein product [Cladocopium goreaui]|uniref:Elongation factor 1-alpha (EF-1-alpha) n=2 Tax=Cladocopium goreaui TaxID=2562237 RepID=A0A9P1G002_9DINO|nr:unnamed protein product [Cladocopium goreaui]
MPANSEKPHLSIVICGHVDSGKSTTTGRLIFELGGLPERDLEKLKAEAERLGKGSFAFAFFMDRQKEERERGVTIACTTKEFFTEKWHYTIIDAPGHRDFIKNMITGASQADVALIMVPADGNFTTAIAKGNHKAGEIQGQTRQHSRLINLLGVKQICIGVNKMDCDTAGYKQARYDEVANEMKSMLVKVGWKKDFIEKSTPVMPISGWMGDNLLKKSENMGWWKGQDVEVGSETIHVDTVYDVLDKMCRVPERPVSAPMRMPISGIYKIKGVGDVLAGRVEQGVVKPGEEVVFLPTHTASNPCTGKVFTVEMHHQRVDFANPGDNVGLNIKGLDKNNMPRSGDVMVYKKDTTLGQTKEFDAQIQVLDIPNEIKVGYSPIGFVRCGRAACRVSALKWKMGKETGGKKMEDPHSLKSNEMAQCSFQPQQPLVCDTFKNCEGLSRVAFMDGNGVVMLGKVVSCERKGEGDDKGGKKKPGIAWSAEVDSLAERCSMPCVRELQRHLGMPVAWNEESEESERGSESLGPELLRDTAFASRNAWGSYLKDTGIASFSFTGNGVVVEPIADQDDTPWHVQLTQPIVLDQGGEDYAYYALCVQASSQEAGSLQFAVDADGALNFAVAGGGLRQQLRLRGNGDGDGSAAGCFQFRLGPSMYEYQGRVALDLGAFVDRSEVCHVSLRRCAVRPAAAGLTPLRRCYLAAPEVAGGCQQLEVQTGAIFELNQHGQVAGMQMSYEEWTQICEYPWVNSNLLVAKAYRFWW